MLRRQWSEDWAAEQHVQGVKKPITVNQASAASQGGKEGKLYPGSGPPELACRVQSGGNPLDVTYILIFMNALIAPLKAHPWPGGRYLYKRVRTAKMRGRDICWSPLLTEKKKNLAVILIATGNNYLAVEAGHLNAPFPDHQVWRVYGCDWHIAIQWERDLHSFCEMSVCVCVSVSDNIHFKLHLCCLLRNIHHFAFLFCKIYVYKWLLVHFNEP